MKYKFGFIGTGNMGGAIAKAIAEKIGGQSVILNNRTIEKAKKLADTIGADIGSVEDVMACSEYIVLGVKPQGLGELLSDIKKYVKEEHIFVTMAAGKTIDYISECLEKEVPVIRIMPNMPVKIGEGVTLASHNKRVSFEKYEEFAQVMEKSGVIDLMEENMIDKAMSVSGCGPAYVYMMIEALRDGAINLGIEKDKAQMYAIRTMYGSVKLLLETNEDVSKLRESICSPGGTTIEGVNVLKDKNFDKAISDCLEAAYKKCEKLK